MKSQVDRIANTSVTVTPFTGVWIEIVPGEESARPGAVTPFTGVWIEMRRASR